MSCHRKKFLGSKRNFLSLKETSCHRKEFHAIVRNFLSQEETSFHGFVSEWMSGWEDQNRFWNTNYRCLSSVTPDSRCFGWNIRLKVLATTEWDILSHPDCERGEQSREQSPPNAWITAMTCIKTNNQANYDEVTAHYFVVVLMLY